jgi:enterochelin esterase-like enzyme
MPSIVIVFIDSRQRRADYHAGSPFRGVVTDEILPLIEARYRTNARALRTCRGLPATAGTSLFQTLRLQGGGGFRVSSDGQRFLINAPPDVSERIQ